MDLIEMDHLWMPHVAIQCSGFEPWVTPLRFDYGYSPQSPSRHVYNMTLQIPLAN